MDHAVLDGRPLRLVALVATLGQHIRNPARPLVVRPLPGQRTAELRLDLLDPPFILRNPVGEEEASHA
jgi:hypothetical protein